MTDRWEPIARAHRLVVKVGSSSLTDVTGGLDPQRVRLLVDAVGGARQAGREVVLVSSGAVAAGMAPLGMRTRPRDLASQQAAASVGQGLLIERYTRLFAGHGIRVGQVLLTVDDMTRKANFGNVLRTMTRLLELDVLPIVNENDTVATHEIRFGDNDRLAALVAHLVGADALVLLSDVDALYTSHPSEPDAVRIEEVAHPDELRVDTTRRGAAVGTGGMTTKINAARIAASGGIPVLLANADRAADALAGERIGTLFHRFGKKRPRRLSWLEHASQVRGELVLDAGAVRAVTERKASLLPAGIVAVNGDFHPGEPVNLVNEAGTVVAHGLVTYDAGDLPRIIGRNTKELAASMGPEFEREVVHRDSLVVKARRRRPPAPDPAGAT